LLVSGLQAKGFTVLQANAPEHHASSIVTFYRPGQDMLTLHERLESANILTSLRADRSGQSYLRVSPHFYNSEGELRQMLEAL
jgi:selenocysteine lyase/cysteine desulfurase